MGDIGAHNVGKAFAGGEQLGPARLVQQAAEPVQQLVGIVVDQALDILRAAVLAVGVELAAEVVVQLYPSKPSRLHILTMVVVERKFSLAICWIPTRFSPRSICAVMLVITRFSSSESRFVSRK